jgi:hypothetical protein
MSEQGTVPARLRFPILRKQNRQEKLMTYFRHAAIAVAPIAGATTATAPTAPL